MYSKKYNKKKLKNTRKQKKGGVFYFKRKKYSEPDDFTQENLLIKLMERFQDNKTLNQLIISPDDHKERLHTAIPGAIISQVVTCLFQLNIINRDDIDDKEKYKLAVLYDIEPGKENMNMGERHREFYTSVVLRLWVILNTLKNQYYEYPYNFLHSEFFNVNGNEVLIDSILDRTLLAITEKKYNYLIEPIYLDIEIIKKIILWNKKQLSTNDLVSAIIKQFEINFDILVEYVSEWILNTKPANLINLRGEYFINSYLKFIGRDLNVLRKTLIFDIKIYRKLLAKLLQHKIDIRTESDDDRKIILESNITNLENLTNHMKRVLDKYFSHYGGKKSRKKYKFINNKKYTNRKINSKKRRS